MHSKTIKQVLKKKFAQFIKSIDDPYVKGLVRKNSIITGGSIASMLRNEEVNDYDVYFTNRETVLAVCKYYTVKFSSTNRGSHNFEVIEERDEDKNLIEHGRVKIRVVSSGVAQADDKMPIPVNRTILNDLETKKEKKARKKLEKAKRKAPFRPVYISSNAITLSDQFQLIVRFYGDAEEIHDNYDFAHCTCWWRSEDGHLELPSEALECLLTNELRYKGSKYPLASIIRSRKFIKRGFSINAGQYLKMCLQLNDMNLRSLETLEDQLMGVDAVYFANMIDKIPAEEKMDGSIDATYLLTMIDKFF